MKSNPTVVSRQTGVRRQIIADTLTLNVAFALTEPRKVIRGMLQDRHNTYACREEIVRAVGQQSFDWQNEFWLLANQQGIELT